MSGAATDYVERVEMRRDDWAIFHCQCGDTYQAFLEDGSWWIQLYPADPSEGPFKSVNEVVNLLNVGDA
jgi:hypothetical protein